MWSDSTIDPSFKIKVLTVCLVLDRGLGNDSFHLLKYKLRPIQVFNNLLRFSLLIIPVNTYTDQVSKTLGQYFFLFIVRFKHKNIQ